MSRTRMPRLAARAAALTLPAIAVAFPAVAADGDATASEKRVPASHQFQAFDTNADSYVSREEFTAGMKRAGAFRDFDRNLSAGVDEREIKSGIFRYLDENDDQEIDATEYREGWDAWFPSEPPELEAIDADDDGVVDEREFEQADIDLGVYGGEAQAGEVTEADFYAGIYDSWDENADERLAEDEWYAADRDGPWPLGE